MNRKYIFQNLLAFVCFIAACHVSQKNRDQSLDMQPTFDKQGHRGCRGLMPENTIPAMLKALELGVTTLEMDVVITRDSQVVLSHDPYFNHDISTLPGQVKQSITAANEKDYKIYQMDYAEVRRIDVGLKPYPRFPRQQKMAVSKPLLADLFDSVNAYTALHRPSRPPFFNIETKSQSAGDNIFHPAPAEFVELVMAVIRQKKMEDRVIIQSFDFRTLQYLHAHYPHIKTAMLIEDFDKRSLSAQLNDLGFTPTIYSPAQQLLTEELVRDCHQRGMSVIPWTINTAEGMEHARAMGVDGIISDYPDLFN